MPSQNILIATPAYGSTIKIACHMSLMGLSSFLSSKGIRYDHMCPDVGDIDVVRNFFGSLVLQEKKFTHLLFVDNDMEFQPTAVGRMLGENKPVIGCVYPKRQIDLERFYKEAKTSGFDRALALASEFPVHTIRGNLNVTLANGLTKVPAGGMGLTLIQRGVFEQMAATGKVRTNAEIKHSGLNGPIYGFFDKLAVGAQILSEDISFCERWRELCRGEVWALADEPIGHAGNFTYRARFSALFTTST